MDYRFIHLLYVPTMACNMNCKYCYLEDNTKDDKTKYGVVDTLEYAVNKFKKSRNIIYGYNRIHMTVHFLTDVCFGTLIIYRIYCMCSLISISKDNE